MLTTRSGVGLCGHARNVETGGPADRVGDVTRVAAALPSTRSGWIFETWLIPTTFCGRPVRLFATAPIVPATWVPCHELLPAPQSLK